jgi:hypothetical protein
LRCLTAWPILSVPNYQRRSFADRILDILIHVATALPLPHKRQSYIVLSFAAVNKMQSPRHAERLYAALHLLIFYRSDLGHPWNNGVKINSQKELVCYYS